MDRSQATVRAPAFMALVKSAAVSVLLLRAHKGMAGSSVCTFDRKLQVKDWRMTFVTTPSRRNSST